MSELLTNELLTAEELSSVLEEKIAQLVPAWLAEQTDLHERLVETLVGKPRQLLLPTMSFEEFLAWTNDDISAEWVEGKVILMSPSSTRHQDIVVFLLTLLNIYVTRHKLGRVMTAPYLMRLYQPPRGREPDILFVAQASFDRISKQYLNGPANLAIEVISPESISRDRGDKFREYEMSGVAEYWLIDPQREDVEFYQLDEHGYYRLVLGGHSGEYQSREIAGLTVDVSWLWQDPLPVLW